MQPVQLGYFAIPSPDPARTAAFWVRVFGWELAPPGEDGFIDIESTGLPGGIAPMPGEHVMGWFRVEDVHAAVSRVRALGGSGEDPQEFTFGWTATCADGDGTPFNLWQMADGLFPASRRGTGFSAGEPAYFVLGVQDPERSAEFFGALFGWEFAPAEGGGYRHAVNSAPAGGLATMPRPGLSIWFRVDDMAATLGRIIAAGGSAEGPTSSESGISCDCADDQGVAFAVWEPAPGL